MFSLKKARMAALVLVTFALTFGANAAVTIGSGGNGGTYFALVNDMVKYCGAQTGVTNVETKGAIDNLQQMLDNKLMAGIVQFDVLRYYAEQDDRVEKLRVLMPLHVEEVHIVGLNKSYKEGGIWGIGAKSIEINSIADLRGRKVAAWGGSVLSADYFRSKLKVDYEIIDLSAEKEAPKVAAQLLANGDIQAIFAIGGQPLGWLRDTKVFNKQFKLISIPSDLSDRVKGVYNSVKLNYPNLSGEGTPTVGVQALLMTRDYKTPERVAELVGLRSCVNEKLDTLRESTGVHPKWQSIDTTVDFDRWKKYSPPESPLEKVYPTKKK